MKLEEFEQYYKKFFPDNSKAYSKYESEIEIYGVKYWKLIMTGENGQLVFYRKDTHEPNIDKPINVIYEFFTESDIKALMVKQRFEQK
jgi:hypothetical protein